MRSTLIVMPALMVISCAQSQPVRIVGEDGERNGQYFFRDCATGAEPDVTMRSEAFFSYLKQAESLGAAKGETLLLEVDAIPLDTSSGQLHLGIGRVLSVRRGACGA